MIEKSGLAVPFPLDSRLRRMFGKPSDPMPLVEERSRELFPGQAPIVWEGDPTTFQFSYVSASAADLLGHPVERWSKEASFWADRVVHPEDRSDAIAYCALATAKGRDHVFEYRAVATDGRVVWLRDIVQVIIGVKGIPVLLRGIMFDVTEEKRAEGAAARAIPPSPSPEELRSA